MEKRIFLASPHMSEEGYEKEYIKKVEQIINNEKTKGQI